MNLFLRSVRLGIVVLFAFSTLCLAQSNGSVRAVAKPFTPGEVLTYEAKMSKIISGIAVADLTFSVIKPPNGNGLLIKSEAASKGTLLKLFRYSFLQQYETVIDDVSFRTLRTKKHDVQKERVRNSEAVFDYQERRVTYVESDPAEPTRPPRRIASELDEPATYDLVAGVYALRMLPLAVGKSFELTVSDSGLVYKIPVRVTGKEVQKTVIGRVNCFRVEPDVFGPGRIIEKEGSMIIWITDDDKRVPVRSLINSPLGKVDVRLKRSNVKR